MSSENWIVKPESEWGSPLPESLRQVYSEDFEDVQELCAELAGVFTKGEEVSKELRAEAERLITFLIDEDELVALHARVSFLQFALLRAYESQKAEDRDFAAQSLSCFALLCEPYEFEL